VVKITVNPNHPDFDFWDFVQQYLAAGFNPLGPQGSSNPEYKTLEAYLRHLFGDLPEGAVDWASSDLNGDGFNDLYAIDADGNAHTVYGYDSDGNTEFSEFNEWQYNSFIDEFEEILSSEDPSSGAQELFERYENYGIADNTFIQNSFSFAAPQQILNRVVLGDGDIGVTVQLCSSTVTTNCVDPKAINDLWDDFGRHIQVIFKGLQIPGLPAWLPLPGIMSLPTIGEIWDKITGPFNDAARDQLRDCMSKDDDGDGVANTASYCMENRDIAGIITQGILDGTDDIIDATQEAVQGIVDKALETLDCVKDPAACAGKIKAILEGVLGGADPTQPGLPPWMRAIIIGSQYGDKILKELEKLFNQDINGDGTIGLTGTEEYCEDGVTKKEDAAGTNCPEYVPDYGMCDDELTKKEDAEGTNCPGPEPVVKEGDPCNLEDGSAGTYQFVGDELQCIPEPPEFGFCQDGVTEKEDEEGTNCDEYGGGTPTGPDGIKCEDGYPEGSLTFALQDQQRWWKGNCGEYCNDGTLRPEDGVCEGEGGNGPDDLCDDGSEPFYINFDDDKDGAFTDPRDGKSYTYDPCDQTQPPVEVPGPDDGNDECPDPNQVRRGGVAGAACVTVGQVCFAEPSKYPGDSTTTQQGQYSTEGFCIDVSGGQCTNGNTPEYLPEDTDQDGAFFYDGNSITYDPCADDLSSSMYFTPAPELVCNDENADPPAGDDGGCGPCKSDYAKPEGYDVCTSIVDICAAQNVPGYGPDDAPCKDIDTTDPCTQADPNSQSDGQGGCECKEDYVPDNDENSATFGKCVPSKQDPQELCRDENATNNGELGPCVCPDGFTVSKDGKACISVGLPPETCSDPNAVNDGQDGPCECKPGFSKDPETLLCVQGTTVCDNGATEESGCDTCPDGTSVFEYEDGMCPSTTEECDNGATNFPACTTCPEGAVMSEEGFCLTPGEPPVTPPPTGGGGGGGGGGGMFNPFLAGISYTPQAVPEPPAPPQKDYMAELDNIIKRSLFEGMA